MANDPMWNLDVPTQMRQFAEQSVEQARKAFDGFTRFAVEPVRVSVAPFVALNNTARSRAFHLTVAPTILLGSVDQADFCNTSACNVAPRQFAAKAETQWEATVEVDILTLIRGN